MYFLLLGTLCSMGGGQRTDYEYLITYRLETLANDRGGPSPITRSWKLRWPTSQRAQLATIRCTASNSLSC